MPSYQYRNILSGRKVKPKQTYALYFLGKEKPSIIRVHKIIGYQTLGHVAEVDATIDGERNQSFKCNSRMHWVPIDKSGMLELF